MDSLVVKFMRLLRPNWVGPWWGKLPEWTASLGGRARDSLSLMNALQNLQEHLREAFISMSCSLDTVFNLVPNSCS